MRATVVIPAYNEAATIRAVVERALAQVPDVIVVDDGSTDDTAGQLSDLPVTVLHNTQNLGKGGSLWRGMQYAVEHGAEAVITLDGDGQHAPEDIPALLEAARNDRTLVIAARLRNCENAPKARLYANRFADFWVSWAAGQRITDSQSGFRLYPATLLRTIRIPHQRNRSFVFESEILIEAGRHGYHCAFVPISSVYLKGARRSHFRPVADIARIVIMVAWKLIIWGLYPRGLVRALQRNS
jgi:glycosyltransferase involved in cell wall biosynthesis